MPSPCLGKLLFVRAAAGIVLFIAGGFQVSCSGPPAASVAALPPATVSPPTPRPTPTPDVTDVAHRKANEMGCVPILMYHSIGDPGAYDRNGLNLSPKTFRAHLETLYRGGFYPVNLRDLLIPGFDIPAGKTPVVITFDDARASQFRLRPDGQIDPNCAVGILDAFHRKHPNDWPQRATFFVLPKGPRNPVPFCQEGSEGKKLQYLVRAGYEVANHSTSHAPMANMTPERLRWESENCRKYVQKLAPGATMDTFALPYGIFPKTRNGRAALISAGNKCLTKAWGDVSVSPWDKRFDRQDIDRLVPAPGHAERWLGYLTRPHSASMCRYISDGDPRTLSVPPSLRARVVAARVPGMQIALSEEPFPTKPAPSKPRRKPK